MIQIVAPANSLPAKNTTFGIVFAGADKNLLRLPSELSLIRILCQLSHTMPRWRRINWHGAGYTDEGERVDGDGVRQDSLCKVLPTVQEDYACERGQDVAPVSEATRVRASFDVLAPVVLWPGLQLEDNLPHPTPDDVVKRLENQVKNNPDVEFWRQWLECKSVANSVGWPLDTADMMARFAGRPHVQLPAGALPLIPGERVQVSFANGLTQAEGTVCGVKRRVEGESDVVVEFEDIPGPTFTYNRSRVRRCV